MESNAVQMRDGEMRHDLVDANFGAAALEAVLLTIESFDLNKLNITPYTSTLSGVCTWKVLIELSTKQIVIKHKRLAHDANDDICGH